MSKIIYLDHGATTAVDERVLNKMIPYFNISYGNPSSMYGIGRQNKMVIERARQEVAKVINCNPKEIYFTSCGSESDNLALKGIMYANKEKGKHIITSKVEHPAIMNTCATLKRQGFDITYLNVNKEGFVKLDELRNAIRNDTVLISIMFANNEIGTIQNIMEISKIAKENNIIFHTDAVQAVGNIKIDVQKLGVDSLSMSAHKFYGPKGVGALYVKNDINIDRIQDGGHQEKGMRSGTENVAGIVGLAEALKIAYKELDENNKKILENRNYFIEEIKENFKETTINGNLEHRLPGNINVTFKGKDSLEILLKLDEYGICASSGSACSTGEDKPSYVLTAIGLSPEEAFSTIRFSLGKENIKEEIDYTISILSKI